MMTVKMVGNFSSGILSRKLHVGSHAPVLVVLHDGRQMCELVTIFFQFFTN
jgi:hypothetical protein